ncbi:MAG: DUF262 domain-containing protein [Bacteroides sp.]
MAIHLNAEQKNLMKLFKGSETYIIPPYQRPYSWELKECRQLYDDIVDAFNHQTDREYFVGTIILAVADIADTDCPRIVDGQQRMTTFWLMFKALSVLLPELPVLPQLLHSQEWDGSGERLKILSRVNDANDMEELTAINQWTEAEYEKQTDRYDLDHLHLCGERLKAATLFFYLSFSQFRRDWGKVALCEFVKFMLTSVSILPIEMHAPQIHDAEDKALTIFETINNRGRDLANSDIFKARLYSKAINLWEKEDFIRRWDEVNRLCARLGIGIDVIFSHYKNLIECREANYRPMQSIREFFDGRDGELSHHGYTDIMEELLDIASCLCWLRERAVGTDRIAGWLQVLDGDDEELCDTLLIARLREHGRGEAELDAFLEEAVRIYCASTHFFDGESLRVMTTNVLLGLPLDCNLKEMQSIYVNRDFGFYCAPYYHLALVLEMGGGLVESERMSLVRRHGRKRNDDFAGISYREFSLGNVALVPQSRTARLSEYNDYMERLRQVDPECAELAGNPRLSFSWKDVKAREERKQKVLREFFNRKQ